MNHRLKSFLENDNPELIREMTGLKKALKYRSFDEDWEFLVSDLDRKIFNQKGWPSPAVISYFLITQAYYEHGALEPLAYIYKEHFWPVSGFIQEFITHAKKAGRYDLVEQVWLGVLNTSKRRFFECLPDRERYKDQKELVGYVDEYKQNALASYDNLEGFYRARKNVDAANQLALEKKAFDLEEFKKDLPPPSIEVIDEMLFWEILKQTFSKSPSPEEGRVRLMARLEELNPAGIRKFYSLYAKTMRRLFHWNVWALAYAAQGGCSDDSFHDFRGWMIMQGDPALIDLAIAQPEMAALQVPPDPEMLEGGLLSVIEAAALARTGKLPKLLLVDLEKPKGTEWDEGKFESTFPKLVGHYEK